MMFDDARYSGQLNREKRHSSLHAMWGAGLNVHSKRALEPVLAPSLCCPVRRINIDALLRGSAM